MQIVTASIARCTLVEFIGDGNGISAHEFEDAFSGVEGDNNIGHFTCLMDWAKAARAGNKDYPLPGKISFAHSELLLRFTRVHIVSQDRFVRQVHRFVAEHPEVQHLEIDVQWGRKETSRRTIRIEWHQHMGMLYGPYLDLKFSLNP